MRDFNQLQKDLTIAINDFNENLSLQDVDGLIKFSELAQEFTIIHRELVFLSMVDTDISVKAMTFAIDEAASYVKLSSDKQLECDGKLPAQEEHSEEKSQVFGTMRNFFKRVGYHSVSSDELSALRTAAPTPTGFE